VNAKKTKKAAQQLPPRDLADLCLEADLRVSAIISAQNELQGKQAELAAAIAAAAEPFRADLEGREKALALADAELRQLVLDYRDQFFPGEADKRDLPTAFSSSRSRVRSGASPTSWPGSGTRAWPTYSR